MIHETWNVWKIKGFACLVFILPLTSVQARPIPEDSFYLAPESPGKAEPYDDPDADAIYAVILPTLWPLANAKAEQLVTLRETRAYKMCLQPDPEWEPLLRPAMEDYLRLGRRIRLLQPLLRPTVPCIFLSREEIDGMMRKSGGGWDEFYRRYPKSRGWIELSAVGFNADRTIAIVYAGWHCGWPCGGGSFHVLQKVGGKWRPLEWQGTWCSWGS